MLKRGNVNSGNAAKRQRKEVSLLLESTEEEEEYCINQNKERSSLIYVTKYTSYSQVNRAVLGNNFGLDRLKNIWKYIHIFIPEPSPFQEDLLRALVCSNLYTILGERDYPKLVNFVCREYGWEKVKTCVYGEASRRSGKSFATVCYENAQLIACPQSETGLLSRSLRFPREFQKMMQKRFALCRRHLPSNLIVKKSGDVLFIGFQGEKLEEMSRARAFPGDPASVDVSAI